VTPRNDFKKIQEVHVFRNQTRAGVLSRTASGSVFTYDAKFLEQVRGRTDFATLSALKGIAFTLDTDATRHETFGVNLHPFFAGLLPEGLRFTALRKALKTSEDDLFTLLVAVGTDVIGDISISSVGNNTDSTQNPPYDFNEATFADVFQNTLGTISNNPVFNEPSIPGIQAKISAARITLPIGIKKRKKQYILKLPSSKYPNLIENEHFFMSIAKISGLETAATAIIYDKANQPGLLVERFDRRFDDLKKTFQRIHLEDSCQFMSCYPADKYRLNCFDIAARIRELCTAPDVETAKLIHLIAFCYLIGNGDLHAKNISLMVEPETKIIRLSPAYDLLSTCVYGDRDMALDFEARKRNLKRQHFLNFARRFGMQPRVIESILDDLVETTSSWLPRLQELGLPEKRIVELKGTIEHRRKHLSR